MKNKTDNEKVITRFAPSPTGFLHMGGVRTALYNYLYAKQHGGKYLLRIEDTDTERNKAEWADALIFDLEWLGLKPDDEVAKQSERTEIYKKYLQKLIDGGFAYISKETPVKEGERDEVIRFKNPNKKVQFTDIIRGEMEIDTTDLKDFVIAKSLKEPVYHLAVVVDDFEMGITHIIRAEEHLSNTPRQILIQEAIGATRPTYAHLPLILMEDRTKMSKRKHGETVSLTYYREKGYLPEAIINFVALIGWNPGTDQEILSMDELLKMFKLEKVQKGGAIFNVQKLNWINKEYLKKMDKGKLMKEIESRVPEKFKKMSGFKTNLNKIFKVILDRIEKFSDISGMFETGELDYFFEAPDPSAEILKNTSYLGDTIEIINEINANDFTAEKIKSAIWDFATEKGRGEVLWPMRVALSGKEKSPDPFTLAQILGKEETIKRLINASTK